MASTNRYISLLTTCSLQLPFGKLYTIFSVKKVFIMAIAILEIGSLVSATASDSAALIVGRAIAGAGSAGIIAGTFV
jgi:MFS family permease